MQKILKHKVRNYFLMSKSGKRSSCELTILPKTKSIAKTIMDFLVSKRIDGHFRAGLSRTHGESIETVHDLFNGKQKRISTLKKKSYLKKFKQKCVLRFSKRANEIHDFKKSLGK